MSSAGGKALRKSASKSSRRSNTSTGKILIADLASPAASAAEVSKMAAATLLPPLGNLTVEDLYCMENPGKLLPFIPPVQILGFDESFEPKPVGISIKPELLMSPTASPIDYRSQSIAQRPDAGGSGLVSTSTDATAPEPAAGLLTAAEAEFIASLLGPMEPGCTEFVGHEIKSSKCTEFDRYFFDNCSPRQQSVLQRPQIYSPQDTTYGTRSVAKEYKTMLYDCSKIADPGFKFTLPDVPEPKLVLTKSDHQLLDPSSGNETARTGTIAGTAGFVSADVASAQIGEKTEFIYSAATTTDTDFHAPLPPMNNNLCMDSPAYSSGRGQVAAADGSAPDESAPVGPAPPPAASEEPIDDMCPGFGTKITGQSPEACIDCTEQEKKLFAGYDYTRDHFDELREAYHYFAAPDEMLHVSNFARSLRAIGQNPSKKEIGKMLAIASVRPEDGRITLENYLKAVACWGFKSHADMIRDLVDGMKVFGQNACGEESEEPNFQNLRYALMNYGEPLKEEDVQELMQFAKSEIPGERDSFDNITKRLISQYLPRSQTPTTNPATPS